MTAVEFQVQSQLRDRGTAVSTATHGKAGRAAGPVGVGMGGGLRASQAYCRPAEAWQPTSISWDAYGHPSSLPGPVWVIAVSHD